MGCCKKCNCTDYSSDVLNVLKENQKPMKAAEIAEAAGLEKKDVDKAIKKLKTDDLIESPKRCYYQAK